MKKGNACHFALGALGALSALSLIVVALPARASEVKLGDEHVSDAALDKPGAYHSGAVALNPLGLAIGRISVDFVWAPITHHAIVISPHYQSTTSDVQLGVGDTQQQRFHGFGAELGYRYYTGHRGMDGFFVGPSLIAGSYQASLPGGDVDFTNVGVAFDVGAQTILWDALTVGAGLGLQYTYVDHDFGSLPDSASTIAGGGLKPRLLASVGYAF